VAKAAAPTPKHVEWDASWGRFAGLYRNWMGDTQVVELNQRLVMINPVGPNPKNQTSLTPLGNGRFRFENVAGGFPIGEVVRFVEQNGKVVRMYTGESYSERVAP